MPRSADPQANAALLGAAEAVFAENGLTATKVEDIEGRAGLPKGAFYVHFDTKEAALEQIVRGFLAECGAFFAPPSAYPDVSEDAAELLDFHFERDVAVYEFLWQKRAVLRVLDRCQGDYAHLVESFRAEVDRTSREWIEHNKREGIFRADVDVEIATVLVSGAYHQLTVMMLRAGDERPPLEQWLAFAQDSFARAFGTPELLRVIEEGPRRSDIASLVRHGAPARKSV